MGLSFKQAAAQKSSKLEHRKLSIHGLYNNIPATMIQASFNPAKRTLDDSSGGGTRIEFARAVVLQDKMDIHAAIKSGNLDLHCGGEIYRKRYGELWDAYYTRCTTRLREYSGVPDTLVA